MTVKATFVAALPEAQRISKFLDRDYGEDGVAVSLDERADGLWSVDAYFERGTTDEIAGRLRDWLGADAFGVPFGVETLADTNWIAEGLKELRPVTAGRFFVHGSHDRNRLPKGRIAIEIDAGQAFGTGQHATTTGCLKLLDRLIRARRYRSPLDLGTGSGVLAIALAKTLRRRVLATDIDPVAAEVARENAAMNRVTHLVHTVTAAGISHGLIRRSAPFDLVVANILAEPLQRLAPQLVPLVARGGTLLLSGLLANQRERVVSAYGLQGARLQMTSTFDGWSVLVLRKP